MTLRKFLRTKTQPLELCVIRQSGWVIATAWIDYEDVFLIHPNISDEVVKNEEWGTLSIVNKNGAEIEIPCHYIGI